MILWSFTGLLICLYGGWLLHDLTVLVKNPELAQSELELDEELVPTVMKVFAVLCAVMVVLGFKLFSWGLLESILMLR